MAAGADVFPANLCSLLILGVVIVSSFVQIRPVKRPARLWVRNTGTQNRRIGTTGAGRSRWSGYAPGAKRIRDTGNAGSGNGELRYKMT